MSTHSHQTLREALGAYVLGQLEPELATAVEEHLATCASCRAEYDELAPLAGMLSGVDPERAAASALPDQPPRQLDRRIDETLHAVRTPEPRVRRWRMAAVAGVSAVAGVAAATGVVALVWPEQPDLPPVETVAVDEISGIDASAALVDHTWGMEIKLVGSGFEEDVAYDVVVQDEDGSRYSSGAFVGVGGNTLTCNMTSAVLRDDASKFVVRDPSGQVVVQADLRA